jgi:hypothetical protein
MGLVLTLVGTKQAFAQAGMGSINGVVTDPSGAVIPGANVSLESTLQHEARKTTTDSAGLYVIPAVLPGSYRLVVSKTGFMTQTVENISISSAQGSTLNIALQVGTTTQQVTVVEKSPLLQTTTATVGGTVDSMFVATLPLNGRNFQNLLPTLAGVASFNYTYHGLAFASEGYNASIQGQRLRDNQFTIDGVPNMELEFNEAPMFPPPDAIAEMKVQGGMDQPIYGWASGGSIDLVTKSGTNQYHGDVYEYIQNNDLNARSFFQTSIGAYRRNQFGGTFGGPLAIPHILSKNRAWYVFGYYEGIRKDTNGPYTGFQETAAEMQGNFAADAPIYNPYTTLTEANGSYVRQPFAGNIIPSGATTVCAPQSTCINSAALTIYQTFEPTANYPSGIIPGVNYVGTSITSTNYDNWSARVDHQFGSTNTFFARFSSAREPIFSVSLPTLPTTTHIDLANVGVGFTHTFGPSFVLTARYGVARTNDQARTGVPATQAAVVQVGLTSTFPPFYGNDLIPPLTIAGYPGPAEAPSILGPEWIHSWTADWQKITGRHTVVFGGSFYRGSFFTDNQTGTLETFATTQTSNFVSGTGNALASYLLGVPATAGRVVGSTAGNMLGYAGGAYIGDAWQMTRKLHVNAGLRWDYIPPMVNLAGSGTFSYETGLYYWDKTNPITGAAPNIRRGVIVPDHREFQPRIGLAYSATPKTVLRGSYAIFFDNFAVGWTQSEQGNRGNWPFAFPQSLASLNLTVPSAFFVNPFPGPAAGSTTPLGCQQCLEMWPASTRQPYTQEWSASIQRQITPSIKLDVAYFGSHSVKLTGQLQDNSAVTPGTNTYTLRQQWPQFPPFSSNELNWYPAYYDGLDATLTKQYSQNFHLNVAYTWSKTLDVLDDLRDLSNSSFTPTRFNRFEYKGPAGFDIRQLFAASYVYDIPVHAQNRLLNGVVGGWQHSGVVRIDNGNRYYALIASDNANVGTSNGIDQDTPNLLCNPMANVHPTPNAMFNTACYQLATFGSYGDAGKHALYGPGMFNWDADLAKKWPFAESRDVEFRAEFFNLPNSSTWSNPGYIYATSTFGKTSGTRQGGRLIQFSLKIHF